MKFTDAQQMHKKYPQTFDAPDKLELSSIKIGDVVKVCADNKERFWADVIDIEGNIISCIVDNHLICIDEFNYNDLICVKFEHIYDIISKEI